MCQEKSDCKVKPHTEQTAYDDDISNSTDVQILCTFYNRIAMQSSVRTWSQLSSLGGFNFVTLKAQCESMLCGNRACQHICCSQLYIPKLTIYIESRSLWHHNNHPCFKSHQYLNSFHFDFNGLKHSKVTSNWTEKAKRCTLWHYFDTI